GPSISGRAVTARSDAQRASVRRDCRGDRPAARRRRCLVGLLAAVDVRQPGSAQTASRGEKRQGFQQVGLSGAVRAGQYNRFCSHRETNFAIVAEIRQYEAGYSDTAYLGAGIAAGFLHLGWHWYYIGSNAALCQDFGRATASFPVPDGKIR